MILHLGVKDIPYSRAPGSRQRKATAGTVTTGDVAGWLEAKYQVMENFVDLHADEVGDDIANSLAGHLENIMMGAPSSDNAFSGAASMIETRFQKFIESGEIESLSIPGVPTQASIDRRSARFKRRKSTRPRPSFVNTGLYSRSFTAWVTKG
jgi:hypothetical protein